MDFKEYSELFHAGIPSGRRRGEEARSSRSKDSVTQDYALYRDLFQLVYGREKDYLPDYYRSLFNTLWHKYGIPGERGLAQDGYDFAFSGNDRSTANAIFTEAKKNRQKIHDNIRSGVGGPKKNAQMTRGTSTSSWRKDRGR